MTRPPLPPPHARHSYRYYDLVMAAFVCVLLCSNLIGPAKVCQVGPLTFGAGNLFFPLSYIFGDILTEVYGYARSRKVIWAGLAAQVFATVMIHVVLTMPTHVDDAFQRQYQPALEMAFGSTWRIIAASVIAFWAGEFLNSYVLARMKVLTGGRWLWTRTIGSTFVGQAVDSAIFYPLAFAGLWETDTLVRVMLTNWGVKVAWEAIITPVTYAIVAFLKRAEHEDWYDVDTKFTPFSLKD